jgi:hypothetical protein
VFPFKPENARIGPGFYTQDGFDQAQHAQGAEQLKGIFSRTSRATSYNKNPGPGAYQQNDPDAIGLKIEDANVFPRGARPEVF